MDKLAEAIEDVKEALEFFASKGKNPIEEATRDTLINPILIALGWHVRKPRLVETQYEVLTSGDDRAVDYALLDDSVDRPIAFVEAKRLSNGLGAQEERQIRNYVWTYVGGLGLKRASKFGPAVLTNGRVWKFYPVDAGEGEDYYGDWAYSINLDEGEPANNRDELTRLLSHERVLNGEAHQALVDKFLEGKIAAGWTGLLRNPPDDFIKFVEGKLELGRHEVSAEQLRQVIAGKGTGAVTRAVPSRAASPVASLGAKDSGSRSSPKSPRQTRRTLAVKYEGQLVGDEQGGDAETLGELFKILINQFGEERIKEAWKSVHKRIRWLFADPANTEEHYRHDYILISDDFSVLIYKQGADNQKRLDALATELGISDQLEVNLLEAAAGHSSRTKLRVDYKGERVPGIDRAALMETIRRLVLDFGEAKFLEEYRMLGWEVEDPAVVDQKTAKMDWMQISPDASINIHFSNTEKKSRLDKLAAVLGIEDQLQCEIVPPGAG